MTILLIIKTLKFLLDVAAFVQIQQIWCQSVLISFIVRVLTNSTGNRDQNHALFRRKFHRLFYYARGLRIVMILVSVQLTQSPSRLHPHSHSRS